MKKNNIPTTQKEEESSSLKNQELLFIRRPDLTLDIRLDLAIAGLSPALRDCTIAELCKKYEVSHEFIYGLSRLLKAHSGFVFGIKDMDKLCELTKVLQSMRFFWKVGCIPKVRCTVYRTYLKTGAVFTAQPISYPRP